jgi:hypothetical protein
MKKLYFIEPNLYLPNNITIVGSSKNILKKKNGKKIQKSKFIVRFNYAKTKGFEPHTGSKTNMMVLNNNVYGFIKEKNKQLKKINNHLIISPLKLHLMYTWHTKFKSDLQLYFLEEKKYQYFIALKLIKHFDILLCLLKILIRRKTFSIGFCFILLCIISGIKSDIYGFDLEEDMTKRKHYYKKLNVGNVHDLVAEHSILNKLKNHKLINFYY